MYSRYSYGYLQIPYDLNDQKYQKCQGNQGCALITSVVVVVAVQRSIWAFAHLNDKDDVDMMDDLAKQLMQELKDQRKAHETQMKELMQQMQDMRQNPANNVVGGGGGGNVVPRHPRDPADILREKHQSVFSNLMKCADLKCYIFAHQKTCSASTARCQVQVPNFKCVGVRFKSQLDTG